MSTALYSCDGSFWKWSQALESGDFSRFIHKICIDWSCSVKKRVLSCVLAKLDICSCVSAKTHSLDFGGDLQFLWPHVCWSMRQAGACWTILKTSGFVQAMSATSNFPSLFCFQPFLPQTWRLYSYCLLGLVQGLCAPSNQVLLGRVLAGAWWNLTKELTRTKQPLLWPYFIRTMWFGTGSELLELQLQFWNVLKAVLYFKALWCIQTLFKWPPQSGCLQLYSSFQHQGSRGCPRVYPPPLCHACLADVSEHTNAEVTTTYLFPSILSMPHFWSQPLLKHQSESWDVAIWNGQK